MKFLVGNHTKSNRSILSRTCFTISTNIKMIRHKIPRGCACLQHINRAFQSSHAPLRALGNLRSEIHNRTIRSNVGIHHMDIDIMIRFTRHFGTRLVDLQTLDFNRHHHRCVPWATCEAKKQTGFLAQPAIRWTPYRWAE